jgi:hypothetical protein
MKKYPRYIMVTTDFHGKEFSEWVVRLYANQIEDNSGKKVATPDHLLNRYHRLSNHIPIKESIFNGNIYLTYENLFESKISQEILD